MSTLPAASARQAFFATPALLHRVVQSLVLLEQEPRLNVRHGDRNPKKTTTQPGTACSRSAICNPSVDHQIPLPCSLACPACLRHHDHDLSGQAVSWPTPPEVLDQKAVITHPGQGLEYLAQLAGVSKTFYIAVMPLLWGHLDWTTTHGARVNRRFVNWLERYLAAHATANGGDHSKTTTCFQISTGGGSSTQWIGAGAYVNALQMSRSIWSLFHRGALEALGQAFPNITVLDLLEDSINPGEVVQNDRKEVSFGVMNSQAQVISGDTDSLVELFTGSLTLSDRIWLESEQLSGFYRPRLEDLALCFPKLESLVLPEGGLAMVARSSSMESSGDKRKKGEVIQFRKHAITRSLQSDPPPRGHHAPRSWSTKPASGFHRLRRPHPRSPLSMSAFAEEMSTLFPDFCDDDDHVRFEQLQHVSCTFDPQSLDNLDRVLSDLCVSCLTKVEVRLRPMTLLWLVTTLEVSQGADYGDEDGAGGGSYLGLCIRKVHMILGPECQKKLHWISIPNLDALSKFGFEMDMDERDRAACVCRAEDKEKSYGALVTEEIFHRHCEDLKYPIYLQPDPLDLDPQFFFI